MKLVEIKEVVAKVFRYDPSRDREPRYEIFRIPYEKDMRVLDALNKIGDSLNKSLAFQWCCGTKRCGLCGILINGRPGLACWEPVTEEMVLEPLPNLPIIRDLVVDRSPYNNDCQNMNLFLVRKEPYKGYPEKISHRLMEKVYPLFSCLECMLCYSACPKVEVEWEEFAGPAPLMQLGKFALDPRDGEDRITTLLDKGVFHCASCYACADVCPVNIPVTDVIENLKRLCMIRKKEKSPRYVDTFVSTLRKEGEIDAVTLLMKTEGVSVLKRTLKGIQMGLKGKAHIPVSKGKVNKKDIQKIFDLHGEE